MHRLRTLTLGIGFSLGGAAAAPYHGDTLDLQQPDGTILRALAFGDEFSGRLESLDGYTLIQNPATRRFEYADLSADSTRLVPTGVGYYDSGAMMRRGKDIPPDRKPPPRLKRHLDVKPGVRMRESRLRRQKLQDERLEGRSLRKKLPPGKNPKADTASGKPSSGQPAPGDAEGGSVAPFGSVSSLADASLGQNTGTITGLTLVVDFSDDPATVPVSEIDAFLNQNGYAGHGNNGSVRDYFRDVSGGALEYQNTVPEVLRMPRPKSWYADTGNNGRDSLVYHALTALEARGFDFSTLSLDVYDRIRAINVFYAGGVPNGHGEGLWPHQGSMYGFSADGAESGSYQMSDIGTSLGLGTFCHENGHMLFDWPDLYDYGRTAGGGWESYGIGDYGLMGYKGPDKNPVPPNPYFRAEAGWETPIELTQPLARETRIAANALSSLRWSNPSRPSEYFLIEARTRQGRNAGYPDEGLIVWHIDEATYGNNNQQMTESLHYMVSVEQADGFFQMESGSNRGGAGDLFHAGYRNAFSDTTLPDSKWWNGESSGLELSDISAPGDSMSFTVRNSLWTLADIGNPGQAGTAVVAVDGRVVLEGGGADIWNNADQFSYRYQYLTGNGEVVARIEFLENTDPWAKAGVMLRESLEPGARNVFLAVTPSNGIAFQTRALRGGGTSINQAAGAAPHWLKLVRRGDRLEGFTSVDGTAWTAFGYAVLPVGESLLAGMAVTSHNNATLATAIASGLKVEPSPWNGADLGLPALAGRHEVHGGVFTVQAAGADIWNNADEGYFLAQTFSGEGRLVARVQSLGNTDPWAKAGVMFRAGTDADAAHTFAALTPGNGAVQHRRAQAGGSTQSVQQGGIAAPQWVRLDHRNGEMIAYRSADGIQWIEIARSTATPLGQAGRAGLAVTSHRTDLATTAVFDQVRLQKGFPQLETASLNYGESTGNGNFTLNPGETGWLTVSVANPGTATALRTRGLFSSPDGCFSPPSGTVDFGDIAAGATSAEIEIAFTVSSGCEGGNHDLALLLTDADGDTFSAPLSLYVEKFYALTGTVSAPSGAPVAGAEIECMYFHAAYFATSANDGTYVLDGLRPGTYTCRARAAERPDSPTQSITVPPAATADFVLTRPLLSLNTAAVTATLPSGQATAIARTLSNPGDSPLTFQAILPGTGYAWLDSESPSGPTPVWNDISSTGTALTFDQGFSAAMAVRTLGFSFPFYDSAFTQLYIAPSGYVSFQDHYPFSYDVEIPSAYAPVLLVAGYWDEIDARSGGAVYFRDYGDRAVIQFQDVPTLYGSGTVTFQIVLQADGEIFVHFRSIPAGAAGTTGIQNLTGSLGIGAASGTPYAANDKTVRFFPTDPAWIAAVPASGTLAPGASLSFGLQVDAAALPAGVYRDSLILLNNSAASRVGLPVEVTVEGSGGGGLLREVWLAGGTSVASLTDLPQYPASPYVSYVLTSGFETPVDASDYYGQRVRGYIVPPTTGNYTFWVASDDNSSLRLSTDEHPGHASEIARVSTWTGSRQWEALAEQRSAPQALVAGRRYYVEALHKEGAGGDNLAVGWQGPGIAGDSERPIPVNRLQPFDPGEWFGVDVGGVCAAGGHQTQGSGFTVQAGGADIWGNADEFRFVYRVLAGDGVITARVASLGNTNAWAKAGLMIRESLAAGARNALIAVTPGNGTSFQRRTQAGGSSVNNTVSGGAPRWLRLERSGDLIIASRSSNGTTWTQIGTVNLPVGKEALIGLAVTSHNDCTATQAVFESVTLE